MDKPHTPEERLAFVHGMACAIGITEKYGLLGAKISHQGFCEAWNAAITEEEAQIWFDEADGAFAKLNKEVEQ